MPGTPGNWVGVIQRIATAAGLAVAQRVLYFGAGFTVTDNDTDKRTEITLSPPEYAPLADTEVQPALAATGNEVVVLALADSDGPSLVRQVELFLTDDVAGDPTDFRTVSIVDVDPVAGIAFAVLIPGGDHDTTAGWSALTTPFATAPYELAAGHFLAASWSSAAAGVVIPNGVWKVLQ
jgi:hypothetical protein